ncbi:hypothetical protein DRF65_14585 [Chryseobacterium pennae]|uniref:Uncharacterized protein n=1 Tax=Chryseobacterium pennae TaxID=2258962 RepID=A0A3D9C7X1_9FLAO|nr:hypothetical protein DRF65_14585 [Chryseobacterium pennae]
MRLFLFGRPHFIDEVILIKKNIYFFSIFWNKNRTLHFLIFSKFYHTFGKKPKTFYIGGYII